ncbi:heme-dependent oxidative N-demethylase subunit alpha family protein [Ramlibacter sp. AN1015]|uniref:heme-dependent oxidative N-demethylase subunit alpha family protein n=1 Tax=Ramlibacter sp. AN1015 TaxID=3133428 RepID=UPI0030BF794C
MDFDFRQIAVPFRMQPGLSRLDASARQLTALQTHVPLYAEKQAVLARGASRLQVEGFDATPALQAIAQRAAQDGADGPLRSGAPLELAFEEDLVVLDGDGGTLPWLCVCTPSHWAPEDKLGLPFAAVHAPVADNAVLLAASRQLVALATGGERWERRVWTISPSGRHDQHPRRQPRTPWPETDDAEAFARQCFLRSERQTFFPVGRGTRQAVFTIRVRLQRLEDAVAEPWQAQRLHDSLASMSAEVAQYKSVASARPTLLRWLASRGARPSA